MGELVFQLKNWRDKTAVGKIVDRLLEEYGRLQETIDAIIPIPSTNMDRRLQPAYEIAGELGVRVGVPVIEDEIKKQAGWAQLKNVDNPAMRKELLEQYMALTGRHDLTGKITLLIDDCTRLAWAEVVPDITGLTVMFTSLRIINLLNSRCQIQFEEMLSDNGAEFASKKNLDGHPFERMLRELGIRHRYTRPYRLQTNGKVERFGER